MSKVLMMNFVVLSPWVLFFGEHGVMAMKMKNDTDSTDEIVEFANGEQVGCAVSAFSQLPPPPGHVASQLPPQPRLGPNGRPIMFVDFTRGFQNFAPIQYLDPHSPKFNGWWGIILDVNYDAGPVPVARILITDPTNPQMEQRYNTELRDIPQRNLRAPDRMPNDALATIAHVDCSAVREVQRSDGQIVVEKYGPEIYMRAWKPLTFPNRPGKTIHTPVKYDEDESLRVPQTAQPDIRDRSDGGWFDDTADQIKQEYELKIQRDALAGAAEAYNLPSAKPPVEDVPHGLPGLPPPPPMQPAPSAQHERYAPAAPGLHGQVAVQQPMAPVAADQTVDTSLNAFHQLKLQQTRSHQAAGQAALKSSLDLQPQFAAASQDNSTMQLMQAMQANSEAQKKQLELKNAERAKERAFQLQTMMLTLTQTAKMADATRQQQKADDQANSDRLMAQLEDQEKARAHQIECTRLMASDARQKWLEQRSLAMQAEKNTQLELSEKRRQADLDLMKHSQDLRLAENQGIAALHNARMDGLAHQNNLILQQKAQYQQNKLQSEEAMRTQASLFTREQAEKELAHRQEVNEQRRRDKEDFEREERLAEQRRMDQNTRMQTFAMQTEKDIQRQMADAAMQQARINAQLEERRIDSRHAMERANEEATERERDRDRAHDEEWEQNIFQFSFVIFNISNNTHMLEHQLKFNLYVIILTTHQTLTFF